MTLNSHGKNRRGLWLAVKRIDIKILGVKGNRIRTLSKQNSFCKAFSVTGCQLLMNENCALLTTRTLPLINNRTFFGVSIYPIYSNGILYKWKRLTILKLNFIWSEISWHQVSQGTVIAHIDQFKFTFLIC